VEYARIWGGVIKLIGRAAKVGPDRIAAMVSPAFVKNQSQLASVSDVFNAILVRGDAIGDVVFYGRGAGKMPTASAVIADVIDCAKHLYNKKQFGWEDSDEDYVTDYLDSVTALYVRADAENPAQAADDARRLFNAVPLLKADAPGNEIAFVTAKASERDLRAKLADIPGLQQLSVIRVTDY
jgi:homoserine dehydrogenase